MISFASPPSSIGRTIFQAATEGDDLAQSIVGSAIAKLAAAMAGLLHVFDPEVVILGGQIADAGEEARLQIDVHLLRHLLAPLEEDGVIGRLLVGHGQLVGQLAPERTRNEEAKLLRISQWPLAATTAAARSIGHPARSTGTARPNPAKPRASDSLSLRRG